MCTHIHNLFLLEGRVIKITILINHHSSLHNSTMVHTLHATCIVKFNILLRDKFRITIVIVNFLYPCHLHLLAFLHYFFYLAFENLTSHILAVCKWCSNNSLFHFSHLVCTSCAVVRVFAFIWVVGLFCWYQSSSTSCECSTIICLIWFLYSWSWVWKVTHRIQLFIKVLGGNKTRIPLSSDIPASPICGNYAVSWNISSTL